MDFFDRVREVTKLRGTTIEQMMIKICNGENASPRDVYNGWRRRNVLPRADTAVQMAEYLNVTVEYLVKGTDVNPNTEFCNKFFSYKDMLENFEKLTPANKKLIEGSIRAMAGKE